MVRTVFHLLLLGFFSLLPWGVRGAYGDAPKGKITKAAAEATIARGVELIRVNPKDVGKSPVPIRPGDVLQTGNGPVEIAFDDGSLFRVGGNSLLYFPPGRDAVAAPDEPEGKDKSQDLVIRLAMGAVSAALKPSWRKVVLLPLSGRVALLRGDVDLSVRHTGDWQFSIREGEAVLTELRTKLVWKAIAGHKCRVSYVPNGVRISNLPDSSRDTAIQLHAKDPYDMLMVKGDGEIAYADGKCTGIKEGQSLRIEASPPDRVIRGFAPSESLILLRGGKPLPDSDRLRAVLERWDVEGDEE